jgi:hypothetical protein
MVDIRLRSERGKWTTAPAGTWVESALLQALNSWGWDFLVLWLGRVCLKMAQDNSTNDAVADKWIDRYKLVRGMDTRHGN